jgi:acyl-CoA synthetase (AMP-forming)/AMP-acid ligase II
VRTVPDELVGRYLAQGWWTDDSIGDLVHSGLRVDSDAAFVVHSAVRPWRGRLADVGLAARRFGAGLQARGVRPGDVVVCQLPNWLEAGIAFWGAAYAGAVVVPVVHFYGAKELAYIVEVTKPKVVITADRFLKRDYVDDYGDILAGRDLTWLVVGDGISGAATAYEDLLDADPLEAPVPVDPDGPALIAFTSGTTRDPKGVIHSHRTIGFETRQLAVGMPNGAPPSITGAPVGHFIGMLGAFLCPLLRGEPIHLMDVWNPTEVLRLMLDEGIGMAGGATYFLTSLLDHPDFTPDHVKYMPFVGLGGAPVPVAVTERATRLGISVRRSYGSTEHPSISGCAADAPEDKRLTTDGHALTGTEIRLDEIGEISSRGPELFLGYTDARLTAAVFDDDGWYQTGDIGVLDEDGYLTITDRISDVIIRGGENISAQEVEELLLHLDDVAEVAVVAEPHPRLGERAVAVVRLREGHPALTLDEVRAHLAGAGLAKQKWPESLRIVVDLPRTPSGKVQKFRLRQQMREGRLEHEIEPSVIDQQSASSQRAVNQ